MPIVAGHQTNHLPYGGYFAKMNSVDTFVLVDNTQYVKKQYHNRNRILLENGTPIWLSVPVITSGRFHQKLNEVEINNRSNWKSKHLKTIEINYRKCKYFDDVFSKLVQVYDRDWTLLAEFNIEIINLCKRYLGIKTPLLIGSELGISGKASELIADICKKTSSGTYLHGMHSRDYVDFQLLKKHSINSKIQDFSCVAYTQSAHPFVPNLSVIDLMFNCGSKSLEILMQGNHIVKYE